MSEKGHEMRHRAGRVGKPDDGQDKGTGEKDDRRVSSRRGMMEKEIASFSKNRTELVMVRLLDFKEKRYVDIRVLLKPGEGDRKRDHHPR